MPMWTARAIRNIFALGDVKPVVGWFYNPKLGQVWYENRHNNTEVYSVRQITEPKLPFAPKFGGLVIAKVPGMGEGNNVFFGEWAPRKGNPSDNSTDLNMADSKRTVWYVGDNPTRNMPKLVNAKYNVLGVNKHTPGRNDFYTGTLTANYGTGSGSLTGSISRPGDSCKTSPVPIFGATVRLTTARQTNILPAVSTATVRKPWPVSWIARERIKT